jgi:hypothetical protein
LTVLKVKALCFVLLDLRKLFTPCTKAGAKEQSCGKPPEDIHGYWLPGKLRVGGPQKSKKAADKEVRKTEYDRAAKQPKVAQYRGEGIRHPANLIFLAIETPSISALRRVSHSCGLYQTDNELAFGFD